MKVCPRSVVGFALNKDISRWYKMNFVASNIKLLLVAVTISAAFMALSFNLETTPPLWWDEGWTMSVARNWVELGHYGRLLDGHVAPRGLEAGFPVTASIAFSFAVFGVGVYQARLVAVVFTIAALVSLYLLACRFYNRSIAIGTLAVLIFMCGHVDINPLIAGRQVLGEIPALFFLLAGYLTFLQAENRPVVAVPLAAVFWSLALFTKVQVQPFWAASLVLPLLLVIFRRRWGLAGLIASGLVGSVALFLWFQHYFSENVTSSPVSGLTRVIALAFSKHARLAVLDETLQFGLPTLFGLCWGFWILLRSGYKLESHVNAVRFSFLTLTLSWFAWYEFLSLGWPRYFLPPAFLGSMFVAAMLHDWTNKFSLTSTVERSASLLKKLGFSQTSLAAIVAVMLIAMSSGRTLTILYEAYVLDADGSIKETIDFLNTKTPPNSLIETYESELFVFLNRRYHYPPDQIHVELIRKFSLGEQVTIDYDPVASDPDYLVVGPQNRFWDFYDAHLTSGAFRSLQKYSRYEIYERVRSPSGN
jgi:hypothetical protein